jgi:hypothetical protein
MIESLAIGRLTQIAQPQFKFHMVHYYVMTILACGLLDGASLFLHTRRARFLKFTKERMHSGGNY